MSNSLTNESPSDESPSKMIRFLYMIDLYRYLPVPTAYPVSTKNSRIGSLIFICVLLGYLIYSFYLFLAKNVPKTNSYMISNSNSGYHTLPDFAFSITQINSATGQAQRYIDNSVYSIGIYAQVQYGEVNKSILQTQVMQIPIGDCNQTSLKGLPSLYACPNLTAFKQNLANNTNITAKYLNSDNKLQIQLNSTSTNISIMSYFISIQMCAYSPYCLPIDDIYESLGNDTMFQLAFKQPEGYDYINGQPISPIFDYSIKYQNYIINPYQQLSLLYLFQPTSFITSPNYFTTFRNKYLDYTMIGSIDSNIKPYPGQLVDVIFSSTFTKNVVQITPQTIIQKLSEWSAFGNLLFLVGMIIFLRHNKKQFNKRNPDWIRFDRMLEEKLNKKQFQLEQIKTNLNQSIREELITPDESNKNNTVKDTVNDRVNNQKL